jgi:AsmA protein
MRKFIRILVWLVGILVALIVVAAVVLPLVVDPNDYKDDIAAAVQAGTGRKLTIEGDLGLSVFPWLALEIGPTRLANAEGFSGRPFAAVRKASIRIKLLPLLRKQVEMDTVVLDGLQVSLETRDDGRTNWADLTARAGAEPEPEPQAETQEAAPDGGLALAGLAIGGVEISDADVLYDDRQAGSRYQVEGLNLSTGAIAPGAKVPVELSLRLAVAEPPVQGPLNFTGQVTLSGDRQTLTLAQAELKTDLTGDGLPGGAFASRLGFDATLDLATGGLQIPKLVAELLGLTLEASVTGRQLFTEPAINADVEVAPFAPRKLVEALGQPLPEVADKEVLGKADASLKLAATADSAQVSDLLVQLDDSTLKGSAAVSQFARPAVRFDLSLDGIDVDRYLPPPADEPPAPAPAPVTPAAAVAAGAELFPVETLRSLNVAGSLTVDKLKVSGLSISDLLMKLAAKGGQLRVHPAQARLYQGSYAGDMRLDVRGARPKISLDERLDGIQIGPLLKDLQGKDRLTGATRARATLTATGQTPEALKQSLGGNIDFAFTDGAVKGFNLAALIRTASARLKGETPPADQGPDQTDFSELTGTASVTGGVISNNDLEAKSPLLRVQGKGQVDLNREALDYLLTAKVVGSLKGQGGKELDELTGVPIPVQITGSFDKPKYKVRLDKALKESAEEKVKEKLEKKLEKKFGDQFKGLFQ